MSHEKLAIILDINTLNVYKISAKEHQVVDR